MEVALSYAKAAKGSLVTIILRDISERKQAAERLEKEVELRTAELRETKNKLEKALKDQDRYIAGINHDLRTPLTSISGYTKVMIQELTGGWLQSPSYPRAPKLLSDLFEDLLADARVIERASANLEGLIDDVLNHYKLSVGGELDLAPEEFSLTEEILSLQSEIEYLAKKRSNQYLTDLTENLGNVTLDRQKLRRVVWGDAVNTAARIESNGRANCVNLSSRAYQRIAREVPGADHSHVSV